MSRSFSHEPINFKNLPAGIKTLVVANAAVFVLRLIVGRPFDELFGLVPRQVLHDRWIWQIFTYLFVHDGILHLLFNLFALWMFGMPVEAQWGTRDFLKYYFLCGIGAALLTLGLSPHSTLPVVGASGSVYGLLVAFAMLYPDAVIYLYFLIPISARNMAILFAVIEFFAGVSHSTPMVARFAHLGGMATGYVYIRWWWEIKIKLKAWAGGFIEKAPAVRPPSRRRAAESEAASARAPEEMMEEVDRILDKILSSGLESLTEEERALMKRYSDRTKH